MNEALLLAAGTVVGGLIGAAGRELARLWGVRAGLRRDKERQAITEYQDLLDRQGRQLDAQQLAITQLHDQCADREVKVAELWGCMQRFHDHLLRQAAQIVALGGRPEAVPDMPPRQDAGSDPMHTAEFVARTAAQNTALLKEASSAPPPRKGAP